MKIIEKDITTVEEGIIVHQVNCQGVMGSGVAKVIKEKWPVVFEEYKKSCKLGFNKLGDFHLVEVSDGLQVLNLFGQYKFGYDGKRYTSYAAWEDGLREMYQFFKTSGVQLYFPYNVGCDRGGGDFRIISAMIEEYFPDAIFCKFP